jgi:hypothetical protein
MMPFAISDQHRSIEDVTQENTPSIFNVLLRERGG